jgi:putative transcriptional regulator
MSKIAEAMMETAQGLFDAGVMSKLTLRQMEELYLSPPDKMTPEEIKELRLECNVSQSVFARFLNVRLVTVKKWESGANSPGGAALKLLQIIKQNGLEPLKL